MEKLSSNTEKLGAKLDVFINTCIPALKPDQFWVLLDIGRNPFLPHFMRLETGEEKARRIKYFTCFDFPVHEKKIFIFPSPGFKLQLLLLQPQLIFHLPKRGKKLSSLWIPRETFCSDLQLVVALGK